MALFVERGYAATTTAQIARRAGVSEMTLFRHFASKSAFLVEDPYDPLIAAAVRARPSDEPALPATIRGIRAAWAAVEPPDVAIVRERLRIVATTPSLRGALAAGSAATEQAIVDALVERDTPAPESRVVAAAVVAGLNAALIDWSLSDDANISTALQTAFRALGEA
ncbi:TetR family transcriptional regulator [Microbacterium pumilum]|uniref:TetR family transcriptional regulator n=2 Tax=Microbacterium pumilum TaxID=344165 RepID=A0ABP5DM41_9MICO